MDSFIIFLQEFDSNCINPPITASSCTIAVQIHKINSNMDKTETTVGNTDTSTASIKAHETNTRATKDKAKRIVTTVSEDVGTNSVPNKTVEEYVRKEDNDIPITNTGIETQEEHAKIQEEIEPPAVNVTEGGEIVQSVGAVVTEAVVSAGSSSSNRKWRHITADCLACVRTRPPSSHELREAFFASKICFCVNNVRRRGFRLFLDFSIGTS